MAVFVDEARIFVSAGKGGNGCESFYSDKRMRHPRPDGGDGGKGGDVIFEASRSIQTLLDYKFRQHHKAKKGGHASSKGKYGKTGLDCILKVPVGTIIRDADTNLLVKDLVFDGQSIVVARGGRGGVGNDHKKTFKPPQDGQEKTILLELKIMADVGLIGFPNVGKSTLISAISKVRSEVANYPFTTKKPILGFVSQDDFEFVIADLPGLIEGAHDGRGLGDKFLKHAERTKILVHVLDMAGVEGRDPIEDYRKINHELREYSHKLFFKKRIVVANKMDLSKSRVNLKRFKKEFKDKIFSVSAVEKQGLNNLVNEIRKILCHENSEEK
ncbi:MAG: GTPase ObgE [Candidatus Aceula lacicola]|nr:GTPase ObgE [Candidatus Aceula lacicola]